MESGAGTLANSSTLTPGRARSLFNSYACAKLELEFVRLLNYSFIFARFYSYNGSFTNPPCTEGGLWFVQATPLSITPDLSSVMMEQQGGPPGNARPTQPQNGRYLNFQVNKDKEPCV